MAITQHYVDPSINANSGTGTIGDPYGDLQYALDTVTRDSTNGDQFNIKSGTAEVLTATLSLTSYGTPASNAHLIFSGYTSAANDGGIGIIDGDGSYPALSMPRYVDVKDLELRNSGANTIAGGNNKDYNTMTNCIIHENSGATYGVVGWNLSGCHFYEIGATTAVAACHAYGCGIFQGTTNTFSRAIGADRAKTIRNVIYVTDNARGYFAHNGLFQDVSGNSFIMNGGDAIYMSGSGYGNVIRDNLIEGAGTGIYLNTNGITQGNAVYNSSNTDYNIGNFEWENESLSASPFEKTGAATWANAKAYFAPANVGSVRTGAYSSIDGVKGAIGVQAASGGGNVIVIED